jgi:hypothetical protein
VGSATQNNPFQQRRNEKQKGDDYEARGRENLGVGPQINRDGLSLQGIYCSNHKDAHN